MKAVSPYLNFAGHTEKAFDFYQSVFGGEVEMQKRTCGAAGEAHLPDHLPPGDPETGDRNRKRRDRRPPPWTGSTRPPHPSRRRLS